MYASILLWFCGLIFTVQSQVIPTPIFITPCKLFNSNILECFGQRLGTSRPSWSSRIEESLRHAEQIYLPKLTVSWKNSTIGPYEVHFKNVMVKGARNYQVLTNYANPSELLIRLKFLFPTLRWSSAGFGIGQPLGFDVNNTFSVYIDIRNLVLDFILDGTDYVLDGRRFIGWREGSVEVNYNSIHINVYDIFEDPNKTQKFNDFLNQNIPKLDTDLHHIIVRSLGHFIIELINIVHASYPVDVLYPLI